MYNDENDLIIVHARNFQVKSNHSNSHAQPLRRIGAVSDRHLEGITFLETDLASINLRGSFFTFEK